MEHLKHLKNNHTNCTHVGTQAPLAHLPNLLTTRFTPGIVEGLEPEVDGEGDTSWGKRYYQTPETPKE